MNEVIINSYIFDTFVNDTFGIILKCQFRVSSDSNKNVVVILNSLQSMKFD